MHILFFVFNIKALDFVRNEKQRTFKNTCKKSKEIILYFNYAGNRLGKVLHSLLQMNFSSLTDYLLSRNFVSPDAYVEKNHYHPVFY